MQLYAIKRSVTGLGLFALINHSCQPNAEAVITRGRVWIWAKRAIKPGEEIVYDYGKEYFDGVIRQIGCKCSKCADG